MSLLGGNGNGKLVSARFRGIESNCSYELYSAGSDKTYLVSNEKRYGKIVKKHIEAVVYKYLQNCDLTHVETVHRVYVDEGLHSVFESTRLRIDGKIITSNISESKVTQSAAGVQLIAGLYK